MNKNELKNYLIGFLEIVFVFTVCGATFYLLADICEKIVK